MFKKLKTIQTFIVSALFLMLLLPWNSFLGTKMDIMNSLALPSMKHPLGTDSMGRDFLVRFHETIIASIIPIWSICLLVTIIGILLTLLVLGSNLKKLDGFISGINVLVVSVPTTILAMFLSVYFEEVCFEILVITLSILIFSRNYSFISSQYKRSMNLGFWKSHEMMGGSQLSRVWSYGVIGAWRKGLIELFFIHLQLAFIIEITMSYLGFGIQEPLPSFGNMFKSHFDLILRGDFYSISIIVMFMCIVLLMPRILYKSLILSPYIFQTDLKETH